MFSPMNCKLILTSHYDQTWTYSRNMKPLSKDTVVQACERINYQIPPHLIKNHGLTTTKHLYIPDCQPTLLGQVEQNNKIWAGFSIKHEDVIPLPQLCTLFNLWSACVGWRELQATGPVVDTGYVPWEHLTPFLNKPRVHPLHQNTKMALSKCLLHQTTIPLNHQTTINGRQL